MPPAMKSSIRRQEHGGGSSEFVRIVFSPMSQGLRLPTVFMENHGQSIDDGTKVTLKVPSGDSWLVHLRRNDTGLWLGQGWGEFAQYYEIEVRYFLLFKYLGRAEFEVSIMDPTGSEIEYPMDDEEGVEGMEDLDAAIEKEVVDSHRSFESENLFFSSIMRPSYVTNRYMLSLNTSYVRDFLPRDKSPCTVQVSVAGRNQVWTLHWNVYREGKTVNVPKGWKQFAVDNQLRVKDACVFELVNPAELRFQVTIFRHS